MSTPDQKQLLLAHFVHRGCDDQKTNGCNTHGAVEFGAKKIAIKKEEPKRDLDRAMVESMNILDLSTVIDTFSSSPKKGKTETFAQESAATRTLNPHAPTFAPFKDSTQHHMMPIDEMPETSMTTMTTGTHKTTVVDAIRAAVADHVMLNHGSTLKKVNKDIGIVIITAAVNWKDHGFGDNLMKMSDEMAWKQIKLALARNSNDYLRVEFTANLI
ncbi:hypothetical protein F5Y15DRAFT_414358 [Xylariaceae sp. FL0016]|nr:hypothetical protein F5Y15DRAFT_414358 [Xylariaceae sp. FL0016]